MSVSDAELISFLDSIYDTSSSDECTVINEQFSITDLKSDRKKRIRKRKRSPQTGPKLIKDDIRRSYANMMVNVANASDFPLLFGFLCTFYIPNVQNSFRTPMKGLNEGYYHTLHGINTVAQLSYNNMKVSPDSIFTLNQVDADSEWSRIVCHVTVSGTQLFEDDSVSTMNSRLLDMCEESDDSSAIMQRITSNTHLFEQKLVPRISPEPFTVTCKIIICTNEDKMISSVELVTNYYDELPKSFIYNV